MAAVIRNRELRRLELSWGAFFLVEWTTLIGLAVWAFDAGGATAVGVVGLVRLLPGALALPFGSWAVDRFPRQRVVVGVFVSMSVVLSAIVIATAVEAPTVVVFVLAGIAGIVAAPCRPAQLAMVPALARSPEELVAANVTFGFLESAATLVGPLLAGLALIGADPSVVLGLAVVASLGGLAAMVRLTLPIDPSRVVRHSRERPMQSLVGGLHEVRRTPDLALIVACYVAQLLVRGVLGVLLVAVSFDLLGLGRAGVGWLGMALGVGGLVGSLVAVGLTGRRRLGTPFALGLLLWGLPIAVIGFVPATAVVFGALAVVGFGDAVLDVAGATILQRIGDDKMLGRIFGVTFTVGTAVAGLGSLLAPALVAGIGLRSTLIAAGALLPIVAVTARGRLRQLDARSELSSESLDVILALPLLSPLPPTTLEKIAARSSATDAAAGEVILEEGQRGDRFYMIASGEVEVSRAGASIATLRSGEHFGEIAFVSGSTRTATVTARVPTRLVTLDGCDFLDAVGCSDGALAATLAISDQRVSQHRGVRAGGT